ncbi:hypothetical protein TcWFU_009884 [Taenia crassiceps]|uniref:Uncharacterized protein n=1 Tax=Taenia crassiceps TaxID=6207 RepID=A0ABR4Q8K2_9CEST
MSTEWRRNWLKNQFNTVTKFRIPLSVVTSVVIPASSAVSITVAARVHASAPVVDVVRRMVITEMMDSAVDNNEIISCCQFYSPVHPLIC